MESAMKFNFQLVLLLNRIKGAADAQAVKQRVKAI